MPIAGLTVSLSWCWCWCSCCCCCCGGSGSNQPGSRFHSDWHWSGDAGSVVTSWATRTQELSGALSQTLTLLLNSWSWEWERTEKSRKNRKSGNVRKLGRKTKLFCERRHCMTVNYKEGVSFIHCMGILLETNKPRECLYASNQYWMGISCLFTHVCPSVSQLKDTFLKNKKQTQSFLQSCDAFVPCNWQSSWQEVTHSPRREKYKNRHRVSLKVKLDKQTQ